MPFFRRKADSATSSKASSKHSSPVSSPSPKLSSRALRNNVLTPDADVGLPVDLLQPRSNVRSKTSTPVMSRSTSFAEQSTGDLGSYSYMKEAPMPSTSRLSKTMQEVLDSKDALGYFIQFMESRDAGRFVRFWLDAESFQAATWTRIRSHSLNAMSQSSVSKSPTRVGQSSNHQSPSRSSPNHQSPNALHQSPTRTVQQSPNHQSPRSVCENHVGLSNGPIQPGDMVQPGVRIDSNQPGQVTQPGDLSPEPGDRGDRGIYMGNDDPLGEKLRRSVEKDAVAIYSRYISLDATKPIGISDELRNETIRKICCEDGRVDPLCFVECQEFVHKTMSDEYFDSFTRSEFYCQHQIDFLTSGDVRLPDMLYNETSMFYFMEFVEREGGSNLLQFLMNVDNFEELLMKSHGGYDGLQAQGDAMVLYDKYFSLQASSPLGFDDRIRFEIESNICREGGPLPQCFHPARSLVLAFIDRNYFKQFLSSDIYFKYLSELITATQSSQETVQRRKRCGSDASSDHSAPSANSGDNRTKNTLLATDGSKLKVVASLKEGDFRIDMGSIINPETLYQRSVGKLSLGHVNSMGHFISDFDREPDHQKKAESFFSRKKRDKDRAQEDMAVKIAQMIINDVTSLTGDEDDDS